jgi:hypothetical protein
MTLLLLILDTLCRKWLVRRLIITKDILAFAQLDDDIMIDNIPLAEIEDIRIMETDDEELEYINNRPCDDATTKSENLEHHSLVLKTAPGGHNRGRNYYLRAHSVETCQKLVNSIKQAALSAKIREEAHSRFAKTQFALRQIYFSSPFQYTSASLIAAVSQPLIAP